MTVPTDFWVAAATIAPVAALAHTVNIGRYLYWQHMVLVNIKKRRTLTFTAPTERDLSEYQTFRKRVLRASNTIGVAIWASILAVITCAIAMFQTLEALRNDGGSYGLSTAVVIELMIALVFLVLDAGMEGLARLIARREDADLTLPA